MSRAPLLLPLLFVACRQVAGIQPITYQNTGGDGGGGCTNATMVLSSTNYLDVMTITNGYVVIANASETDFTYTNLYACSLGTPCTQPPGLLSLAFNDALYSYAASSQIYYALQTSAAGAGAIHSLSFDGKTDTVLLGTATFPTYTAVSGTHVFWVSDDQSGSSASVHCIGCSGPGDQTWISGLTAAYGLFADANNVYVVSDDSSVNGTMGIYGCSVTAACNAAPRKVIEGITIQALNVGAQAAGDGTNVYVTNDSSAIVSVGPTGTQTDVVKGTAALSLAVDPSTSDLFYATDQGQILRIKSDGTGTAAPLSTCDPQSPNAVIGLAFDTANVYALVQPSTTSSTVYAIKRN